MLIKRFTELNAILLNSGSITQIISVTSSVEQGDSLISKEYTRIKNHVQEHCTLNNIRYTLIQSCSAFMQIFLERFINIPEEGCFRLPLGDFAPSWLDIRDLAFMVAEVINVENAHLHYNSLYYISGPEAIKCEDLAALMSKATLSNINYMDITPKQLASMLNTESTSGDETEYIMENAIHIPKLDKWNIQQNFLNLSELSSITVNGIVSCMFTDIAQKELTTFSRFIVEHMHFFKERHKTYCMVVIYLTLVSTTEYDAISKQFSSIASSNEIDYSSFSKSLGCLLHADDLFTPVAQGIFRMFDIERNNTIDHDSFVTALSVLTKGSRLEQLECIYTNLTHPSIF